MPTSRSARPGNGTQPPLTIDGSTRRASAAVCQRIRPAAGQTWPRSPARLRFYRPLDWHGPCSPRRTLGSRGRGEKMGAQDYYFSSKSMPTLGRMWILKMLQEASGSGGGLSMLGSVVQEASERGGFLGLGVSHYPVPMLMSQPRIVTRALAGVRPELGLKPDDPIILIQGLTIANQSIMVDRKDAFNTGVGARPSRPATLGVEREYAKVLRATISSRPRVQST